MAYRVIAAATTEPVSLAEARQHVKATDDISDDALITTWISSAREAAERYTRRALAPQTLEMALDFFPGYGVAGYAQGIGPGVWPSQSEDWRIRRTDLRAERDAIELDMPPVASITSLKYTDQNNVEQTLAADAYSLSLYGDSRIVTPAYGTSWPSTQRIKDAVRIQYVTGYSVCPRAAKAAILLMMGWLYENRGDAIQPDDIQPQAAKSLLNTIKIWGG